jgi:hypothetical protein
MERAIVMMMVSLFLPVQCSMRQIGHHIDRRSGARHGHRLPNHGKQHKENREPTNHSEPHRLQKSAWPSRFDDGAQQDDP